jgi:hypothetical protein
MDSAIPLSADAAENLSTWKIKIYNGGNINDAKLFLLLNLFDCSVKLNTAAEHIRH